MTAPLIAPPAAPATVQPPGVEDLVRRTRVGRQTIHTAQRWTAAYRLMFDAGRTQDDAAEQATSQLIAATFGAFDLETLSAGRPLLVNVTRGFVTGSIPIPVAPDHLVVELASTVSIDSELLAGLHDLLAAGYRVALTGYDGSPTPEPLIGLAAYVGIDTAGIGPATLAVLADRARSGGATLLATNIRDAATMQRCTAAGFELFEGPYLKSSTTLEGRALSPIQLVCARLLGLLDDPDVPIEQIEQLVASDPGLSIRLLRTANSATVGVRNEITSLHQALMLVGPGRLRAWVVLTLLEGSGSADLGDDLWTVLARANACGRLAVAEPDLGYTVGLLSGCADLLGARPAQIADGAGVGESTRRALVDGVGESGRALTAVLAHERNDPDAVLRTGLGPAEVSGAYLEALSEARTVVEGLTG